jgi:hypothetical protein
VQRSELVARLVEQTGRVGCRSWILMRMHAA